MCKPVKRTEVAAGLFLLMFLLLVAMPADAAPPPLKVRIVHDGIFRFADKQPVLVAVMDYIGHFNVEQSAVALADWTPGALAGADIVFFLGLRHSTLPEELLKEMSEAKKLVWAEQGIEQLAAYREWKDFVYEGPRRGWEMIQFRGRRRPAQDWLNCIVARPGKGAEIFSTISNIAASVPYAWRRDNVYFISALEYFEPAGQAVLVDFLYHVMSAERVHDFARQARKVMLRIEDVSPIVDPEALQEVIDVIEGYAIPYAIAVIPVGLTEKQHIYIHEAEWLLQVLKRAQANGASIIMHGYTHQNEFSPTTGEGWEFWNARDDLPMEDDEAFTRDRLEKSFLEFARCGLYPVAFEPPHYAMSSVGYKVLSEYFDVFSGRAQISDESYHISMTLPYIVKSPHLNDMIVLPENMGYYDGDEFTVEEMLKNSRDLLDMPAPFACFFYHGYLPADNLPRVIDGVLRQGYEFFDIRTLNLRAGSSQVQISIEDGELSAVVDPQLLEKWAAEDAKKTGGAIGRLAWFQTVLMGAAVLLFLMVILRLRRNARRKYEVHR